MAQNIDYTVRYNSTSGLYEAYGRPDFDQTDFIVGGGSQFSILLTPQMDQSALVITSVAGGVWTDNTQVYNPDPSAPFDFHSVTTSGGTMDFTANTEALLFTFTVPSNGCVDGLRLFINGMDPESSAPFMMGADFRQSFTDVFSTEFYRENYDNDGIACSVDSDGDGVLDADEVANNTNPNDPCDLIQASVSVNATDQGDCDGDGVTNADEINGTDGDFSTPEDNTDPIDPCDYNLDDITLTPGGDWAVTDCDEDGNVNPNDPNIFEGVAVNDTMSASPGTPVAVNVLTNDDFLSNDDPDNLGTTTLDQVGGTAIGTVVLDPATGELIYTPDISESGMEVTVEYEVCNTDPDPSVCDTATVVFNITDQDSDGDGVTDASEVAEGTDPSDPCELVLASVSQNATDQGDCDGDGVTNADEINGTDGDFSTPDDNTDPTDPCSYNEDDITLTQMGDWADADCDMDGNGNDNDPNTFMATAEDDAADASPDLATSLDILINDDFLPNSDPENQGTTTLNQVGGTATGMVTLDAETGELTYVPVIAESGQIVTIIYEVCNTDPDPDVCDTATISLTISDQDSDGDGLLDSEEITVGTDPTQPCSNTYQTAAEVCAAIANGATGLAGSDCDNGGIPDGEECDRGTDPLDPSDDCPNGGNINIACITSINLTLEDDCAATLLPEMLVTGTYDCIDEFIITVNGVETDQIDGCGSYLYTIDAVFDGEVVYSCWGNIEAEDKVAPALVDSIITPAELFCTELEGIDLNELPNTVSRCFDVDSDGTPVQSNFYNTALGQRLAAGSATGVIPGFFDGCSGMEICVNDMVSGNDPCADRIITRTYTATDGDCPSASGEANPPVTFTYDIIFTRPDANTVQADSTAAEFDCDATYATLPNGNPVPAAEDYPFVTRADGSRLYLTEQGFCNLGATFEDGPRINTCANTFKFVRTWTVIDWCDVNNVQAFTQLVKVGDFNAPVITAPTQDLDFNGIPDVGPLFYSTNTSDCEAVFQIPAGGATDNCDDNPNVVAFIYPSGDFTAIPFGPYAVGDFTLAGIPLGIHTMRYVATDDCGNSSELDVEISIGDATAPVAICEDGLNISIGGPLSQEGNASVELCATDVDAASSDDCSDILLEIRVTQINGIPVSSFNPLNQFQECHTLTCNELGDLEVELRVTDDANNDGLFQAGIDNSNACWLNVLVEDKLAPVCIAPAPLLVTCADLDAGFPQDLNLEFANDPVGTAALLDAQFGVATGLDNCPGTTITQSVVDNRNSCGVGTIVRSFVVTDAQLFTSAPGCTQLITVEGIHDYTIVFPGDEESDQCVEPDYNGVTFTEVGCDLLTVSTSIDTFTATADECYKLRIHYEVLNWCEYNTISPAYVVPRDADNDGNLEEITVVHVLPRLSGIEDDIAYLDRDENRNNGFINEVDTGDGGILPGSNAQGYGQDGSRGAWEYLQFIKVYDDTPPVLTISEPDSAFCSISDDCTGDVSFSWTISEECSPESVTSEVAIDAFIDLGSDGIFTLAEFVADLDFTGQEVNDNGNVSLNIAGLPQGRHALRVQVSDGCGNNAVDLIVFEIADCKAPTPICINGLTATLMPLGSPGGGAPGDTTGGGMAAVWASDFIASPSDDCNGPVKFALYLDGEQPAVANPADTGLVLDCSHLGPQMIRVYAIDAVGNADYCLTSLMVQAFAPGVCDSLGTDAFMAGAIMTPSSEMMDDVEVNISGDMTASEFTTIGLYQFGGLTIGNDYSIEPTHNPVVNLANVSTGDLILISRHILAIEEFTGEYQNLAADVNQDGNINILDIIAIRRVILGLDDGFPMTNSWRFYVANDPDHAEVYSENNLPGNITDIDFIAVEMGNVSDALQDFSSNAEGRGRVLLNLGFDHKLEAGATSTLTFEQLALLGFQGTLELSPEVEVIDVRAKDGQATAFNLEHLANGMIAFSTVGGDGFELELRAVADLQLSKVVKLTNRLTVAEGYSQDGPADLELAFGDMIVAKPELFQNTPNPFIESTQIHFSLPQSTLATLVVQNQKGQILYQTKVDGQRGLNQLTLTNADLKGATGVLTYTLITDGFTATRRMIIQ